MFIYAGMRDRSIRGGTKLAREIQLTDWSTAGNLSNRSSGVQIPRDICTRFGRYLYSTKCSWIIIKNYLKSHYNVLNVHSGKPGLLVKCNPTVTVNGKYAFLHRINILWHQ